MYAEWRHVLHTASAAPQPASHIWMDCSGGGAAAGLWPIPLQLGHRLFLVGGDGPGPHLGANDRLPLPAGAGGLAGPVRCAVDRARARHEVRPRKPQGPPLLCADQHVGLGRRRVDGDALNYRRMDGGALRGRTSRASAVEFLVGPGVWPAARVLLLRAALLRYAAHLGGGRGLLRGAGLLSGRPRLAASP